MRFIDDYFPLIVTVSANKMDAAEVQALSEGFEKYFLRGERYALLNTTPRDFQIPDNSVRMLISQWINHPRVRDFTKRLCVGAATVNRNVLYRVAFNVVMAFQKPATQMECVANLEQGLDFCLGRLKAERLVTAKPLDLIRYELLEQLRPIT
ncbi:MAG TPA: hypothetical protein VEQ59_20375 [Polyangiaceae bacterium]|nr:hypothetical protein [Polyangiaceae bacterium]